MSCRAKLVLLAFTLVFCGFSRAGLAQGTASEELLPVPKALEQGKIDRQIREKYKSEIASREPHDRSALARKFRENADAENDPTTKYVLLREAREFAVDGGDMPYAMDVIDDLSKTFTVNAAEMKAAALSIGYDKSNVSPVDLANSYLKVADDALAVWNLDLAHKAAYLARKTSTGNRDLIAQADRRDKLIGVRNHALIAVVQAEKKIARTPDDPQLNLIIGRHLCFNTNYWDTGLPYLAKSPPGPLTTLAAKDLAGPSDPSAQASLAEAWWDFADVKNGLLAGAGHRRAAYWYAKALPGLVGDKKTEAEKRIADTTSEAPEAR